MSSYIEMAHCCSVRKARSPSDWADRKPLHTGPHVLHAALCGLELIFRHRGTCQRVGCGHKPRKVDEDALAWIPANKVGSCAPQPLTISSTSA